MRGFLVDRIVPDWCSCRVICSCSLCMHGVDGVVIRSHRVRVHDHFGWTKARCGSCVLHQTRRNPCNINPISCALPSDAHAVTHLLYDTGYRLCLVNVVTGAVQPPARRSIDYTIHLAQAYRESTATTREERIIDCLTTMGVSVISASATSILSATVLFFTTIRFFVKFGTPSLWPWSG